VLWICDPMHGNTESTARAAYKTRRFENILRELDVAFRIHEEMGSYLGGVHVELTGEDVTECTGGARGLSDADLQRAYKSTVDPRLNYEQALELAMMIAGTRRMARAARSRRGRRPGRCGTARRARRCRASAIRARSMARSIAAIEKVPSASSGATSIRQSAGSKPWKRNCDSSA
jgi:hypothetical protein